MLLGSPVLSVAQHSSVAVVVSFFAFLGYHSGHFSRLFSSNLDLITRKCILPPLPSNPKC